MKKNTRELIIYSLSALGILTAFGVCNKIENNKTLNSPAYTSASYTEGLFGHVDYTKYADGSSEIISFSKYIMESILFQDFDGDGKVDRIRKQSFWTRSLELITRDEDYNSNKKRFDDADSLLAKLSAKYDIR